MTLISVPVDQAENPSGGKNSNTPFPAGPWTGTIDIVRSRAIPTNDNGQPYSGWQNTDGEVLGIQIGGNTGMDSQEGVGDRKFFVDLTVSDGQLDLTNVELNAFPYASWQLQKSAKRIVNLALALNVATLVEDNGASAWTVPDTFVDSLRNGEFNGMALGYDVIHRKTKSETRPVVDDLGKFFQV